MKPARKNSNGIYVSIRSKLVAAVAMLLVASFMVVSSSYAWFTLSTAPEVTGIHTAVGANGNLEIALDEGQDPGTGVGFGGNNNWGNLIDLNNAIYGLSKITLMPAALNILSDLKMDTGIPLKVPKYGNDGRVMGMDGTITAKADDNGAFKNSGSGVRAIGTSSGMSAQKLDYRSALSQISASTAQIKLYASQSLATSGSQLASAVVGYASNGSDTTKTYNINTVESMVTNLTKANEELVKMIKAYFKAQLAYVEASNPSEDNYRSKQAALELLSVDQLFATGSPVTIPAESQIHTLYAKYQAINTAITTAAAEVAYYKADGRTLEAVPWEETVTVDGATVSHGVRVIFIDSNLVKLNDMKLNGYAANRDLLTNESLVSDIMRDGAILQMGAGCGVYSDFAEIAGNYTVEIVIDEIVYGSLKVTNIAARMATTIENAPTIRIASELQEPASGTASTEISDFYGYAIDLQFRTNAKDSHLMLQTTATNRIYSSGGSEETAGHGSTMTFESTDNNFSSEDVKNLMKFIRVVFVQEGQIVGVGILDPKSFETEGIKVTGKIRLVNFTTPQDGTAYSLQLTTKQGSTEYDFIETTEKGATELISLAQNTIAKLSVYVYLDGENLSNGDVAATSATSMTGSLNLQFSSDANLVPMEYAALRDPLADEGTTETSATTTTQTQPNQGEDVTNP